MPKFAIGRRGAFLLLGGVSWLFIAASLSDASAFRRVAEFPHEQVPMSIRILIWTIPGFAAIIFAFLRKPGQDKWGFVLLIAPGAWRAVSHFIGVAQSLLWPNRYYELFTPGLTSGLVWSLTVCMIMVVAGWPEPRLNGQSSPLFFRRRRNE